MYISSLHSDQDLYLGLLESSRLVSSLESSEPSHFSIAFVHVLKRRVTCMPTYRIPHYFVIFDEQFPLGFAFLFPFLDDWLLLAPFSHQLLHLVEESTHSHVA
jgi:hypothetical protein